MKDSPARDAWDSALLHQHSWMIWSCYTKHAIISCWTNSHLVVVVPRGRGQGHLLLDIGKALSQITHPCAAPAFPNDALFRSTFHLLAQTSAWLTTLLLKRSGLRIARKIHHHCIMPSYHHPLTSVQSEETRVGEAGSQIAGHIS